MTYISSDRRSRFARKVVKAGPAECWLWQAGVNEHGYGVFWNGERLEKAHRFALRAEGVRVDADADVCHTCDNPPCVNPSHLFVGTAQTNNDDMWNKARATVIRRRGTAQNQAKLTDEKAAEIRALWATGDWKQRDLADIYGVSQRLIWNVIHAKNWFAASGKIIEYGRGR